MADMIFDPTPENEKDLWTIERLKEEFFLCLTAVTEIIIPIDSKDHASQPRKSKSVTIKKYYHQAWEIIYLIPRWIPSPAFIINLSDLNSRVLNEFIDYCRNHNERNVTTFLKDVAGRFFENLDYNYYHGNIMRLLKVRLEE